MTSNAVWLLMQIKDLGVKAGVVLNPATPIEAIQHVITQVDLILLMSGKLCGQKHIVPLPLLGTKVHLHITVRYIILSCYMSSLSLVCDLKTTAKRILLQVLYAAVTRLLTSLSTVLCCAVLYCTVLCCAVLPGNRRLRLCVLVLGLQPCCPIKACARQAIKYLGCIVCGLFSNSPFHLEDIKHVGTNTNLLQLIRSRCTELGLLLP